MKKLYQTIHSCSCGHKIDHPQIERIGIYNWWQWSFLIFGISVRPKEYRYKCVICGFLLVFEKEE